MIDKFLDVLHDIFHPDKDWGEFTRKIASLGAAATLAVIGVDIYLDIKSYSDKFIPVSELMESKPNKAGVVRDRMDKMLRAYPQIKGIWLYSWPDAMNVELVHHAGRGEDPLPAGGFHPTESDKVGRLSMDMCTILERKEPNTACAIWAHQDAWGLVVVVWHDKENIPKGSVSLVDSLAHRITHDLYYN